MHSPTLILGPDPKRLAAGVRTRLQTMKMNRRSARCLQRSQAKPEGGRWSLRRLVPTHSEDGKKTGRSDEARWVVGIGVLGSGCWMCRGNIGKRLLRGWWWQANAGSWVVADLWYDMDCRDGCVKLMIGGLWAKWYASGDWNGLWMMFLYSLIS